jgi:hypothetical protein
VLLSQLSQCCSRITLAECLVPCALATSAQAHPPGNINSAVLGRVARVLNSLKGHWPLHDERARSHFVSTARQLVGLGQGLTPAGDDVLVGISAVLRWVGVATLDFALRFTSCSVSTTDVAHVFHYHASCGRYSERILKLFSPQAADAHQVQRLTHFNLTNFAYSTYHTPAR